MERGLAALCILVALLVAGSAWLAIRDWRRRRERRRSWGRYYR